jgi:histidinol-phosphate aminotransferase
MVRTFSKARGLAGLRVGYAVGHEAVIGMLRTTGGPFPVSPVALAAAAAALDEEESVARIVARVRAEREALATLLRRLGADPMPSEANFVTADFSRCKVLCGTPVPGVDAMPPSEHVRHALAARGIAVRGWPSRPDLENLLRITLPADERSFDRLARALTEIFTEEPNS